MQEIILRKPAVLAMIGMKSTWLHDARNAGNFPKPIRIGSRAVGWRRSEIEAWLKSREVA
jgi:prophage regulatory protein